MNKSAFQKGLKDGIPIGLGYFAVSFTFGIMAIQAGLSALQAVLISLTNLTSAGQFAGIGIIAASGSLWEMALTQLVINLRYCLMSFSLSQKLEKGVKDLSLGHFRAADLVKQAIRNLSELFIHKKISIQIGEDLDFTILTDEKWFVFMLEQILTNAVKYTKKGYVSVCRQGEGEIVIMDTGIGILPEDLPRVFEWGYTGYNGRLDKRSTGIGLSLVKSAADLLGHPVKIESEPGKGTKVCIDTRRPKLNTG